MTNIKISSKIMNQDDYIKWIKSIKIMQSKSNTELGLVKIGQKYTSYYKSKFS